MGPKTPKGKNKQAKEVPEFDPENVTEVEKEFFVYQLADIEKKIERIDTREEELKAGTLEYEEKTEEFKKEKGVIIAEHEQILTAKEEEKMQKREEMLSLEEEIKTRIEKHKKYIQTLNEKFAAMVTLLTEKIQEQEEEIRTQEDFKQNKDLYTGKLDQMEQEMIEADLQHQRNLFEIEKKFEVAKKRVKKELHLRLINLSIEFQETTKKKTGKPCHRTTQENKAMQNALIQLGNDIIEYQHKCVISKNNMTMYKGQKNKKMLDKDKMIARTLIQVSVIKTLKEDRLKLINKLKTYEVVEVESKNLSKKFNEVSMELENVINKIQLIEGKIEKKIEDTEEMTEAVNYLRKNYRKTRILTKNAIKLAEEAMSIRLIPVGKMEEERYMPADVKIRLFKNRREVVFNKKGKILRRLLEFLSKGQMTEEDKKYLILAPEDLDYEIDIDFTEVFGRPEGEEEEARESLEEGAEKGPLFLTSLTSMSRSVTAAVEPEVHKIEEVGEEEEEEEIGEGEEDEDQRIMKMDMDYVGEDFEIVEEEEEEEEQEKKSGSEED